MEDLLTVLLKDAQAAKFAPIRQSCQNTLDLLQDKMEMERMPTYLLREKCLEPLQLALESRTKRLMTHAVSGIEKLLKDERFHSSIEIESEGRWLPLQVLNAVYSVPSLPEDVQVDVMKLLLKMTFSSSLCMSGRIIIHVAQVYIDTYSVSTSNVKAVVQAALTQLLGSFSERLANAVRARDAVKPGVMSEFNAKGDPAVESLTEDVVTLLNFLTDKVVAAHKAGQNRQAIPLLLEGIYAILTNAPGLLRTNFSFQQLVWQNLCPTLISLLGIPRAEVKPKNSSDHGLNVECPSLSPHTAKIIYSISVELAKMVGPVGSLRPVLESLFHRILLCPQPLHRHDAVKVIKELLSIPHILCDITVTYSEDKGSTGKSKASCNDLALIKLIIDSIQECCHSSESSLCYTCVNCINDLLTSLEQLVKGVGVHSNSISHIRQKYWQNKQRRPSERRTSSYTTQTDADHPKIDEKHMNGSQPCHHGPRSTTEHETSPANGEQPPPRPDEETTKDLQKERLPEEEDREEEEEEEQVKPSCKDLERESACGFVKELASILPHLLMLNSVADVDENLQKFSSAFSDDISLIERPSPDSEQLSTILNGDSIYYTSYAALCLTLNLSQAGFYDTRDKTLIPISEKRFIDSILDTDMFLYLSPDWLAQVYKCVLQSDLLHEAGWTEEDVPLITSLRDIDGQGNNDQGGQMLRDCVFDSHDDDTVAVDSQLAEAGKLLAHQILTSCWPGILDVLSVLMNNSGVSGVTNTFAIMLGMEGAKEEHLRKREALCACLDGLQKAAKLCCNLGLQERCAAVFAQLANTSCVMEDFKHATQVPLDRTGQKQPSKQKLVRLHAAHILSMDAMMTRGLELGSHSPDCWKHVFRCCAFISELEHTYFSGGNNQSSLPKIQQEHAVDMATEEDNHDFYSGPVVPVVPVAPRINVSSLIKQSSIESGWDRSTTNGGVLNAVQASQALCGLSQEVDRLFEDAASNLTMRSLTAFLSHLCEASKHQLYKISRQLFEDLEQMDYHPLAVNSLHLYRLTHVLMKVVHSDRPLIHLIKAWSVVSSYLVESAGHRDRSISKMAVTCVHDYIIAVMTNCVELKHFHTNEMLCKTFENILCLELCDGDVQDQIVCSICELVEASATDIRSGWRPLFGALRAVRIEYTTIEEVNEARQRHVEAVLDVFDVYLNTDNLLVFANAMVDCILCLLKYVRGPGEFDDSDTEDTDSMSDYMSSSPASENLVLPALQYLKQCSVILQSMWNMPACPLFHGAKRIQVDTSHRMVDPNIPNMNFKKFSRYFLPEEVDSQESVGPDKSPVHRDVLNLSEDKTAGECSSLNSNDSGIILSSNKEVPEKKFYEVYQTESSRDPASYLVSLADLDNQTGILHVWFLMLEGLSGALAACSRHYQPHTMETLFELLRSASHIPGPEFGVYCMNHLLFPMLQSWLRSGSRKFGYWDTGAINFKQCCGHTTDLVVDMLRNFKGNEMVSAMLCRVLQQLLVVLTECVAQPFEVISRLGCSCIRHILLSGSPDFTADMWQIVIDGLQSALEVTTYSVRQLMLMFRCNSENFYGDVGQVKVATRKDSSATDFFRMWNLAQQVFLLDSQVNMTPPQLDNEEDRSYVLLLYPPGYENSLNPDHILARLPFRSVVVGLLSHQLLLQTVGCILLEGPQSGDTQHTEILSRLSMKHVMQLLDCLRSSYKTACDFDLRPGLKFLLQKVAHTQVAVNLYKQAGASMVFYIHTLIKICSTVPSLDIGTVRALLSEKEGKVSPDQDRLQKVESSGTSSCNHAANVADGGGDASKHASDIEGHNRGVDSKGAADDDHHKEPLSSIDTTAASATGDNIKAEADAESSAIEQYSKSQNSTRVEQSNEKNNNADGTKYSVVAEKLKENDNCNDISQTTSTSPESLTLKDNGGEKVADYAGMFVGLLQKVCDELCHTYIDILYDKEGTSCVDSMAAQQLFFLIAQPDDLPEVGRKKLDLDQLSNQLQQTQARLQGLTIAQPVSVQGDDNTVEPPAHSSQQEKESALPPLSPSHKVEKSKREMRTEQESRVYNLATDKLIKNLMTEYKKRKSQNAMPNFAKMTKKEKKVKKAKQKSTDPVEQAIDQQQQSSIMKDSEAHLQSWTELLCSILGLFQQLDDSHFTTLLPTVFSCVNQLVCHAQDMRLREELAQWLHRVGKLYQLAPLGGGGATTVA